MKSGLRVDGFYHTLELYSRLTGELVHSETEHNRIPQEGLDFLIQAPFGLVASVPTFYCGLFRNNYVPVAGTSAADIPSVMGEIVDYAEGSRPAWVYAYNGAGTIDNVANKAVFTPTQERTAIGSFIVSSATKGGNTGLILSVARFATAKVLSPDVEAKLVCGLTYYPTNPT